jgi:glycosyltransferase involved in cell wall biosynthesis
VLESLACGTPVAALDVGAVADMLTDAAVGRIVPARDAMQLACAVRDLLRSGAERLEQRRQARAHACRFDWGSISRAQFEVMTRAAAVASVRRPEVLVPAVPRQL